MSKCSVALSVILSVFLLALSGPRAGSAEPAGALRFKKTVIDTKFRSEGCAIADVNKDGKMDILVGDVWYEAPDWKVHEIRKPGDYKDGLGSYSECMCCWADDINGDGWTDQITIGFPGKPAFWYENPQGKPGHWKEHVAWHSACNETPLYTDLFGNGKRVLVMGWQPKGKEDQGQMAWFTPGKDPSQLWEMHAISEPSVAPLLKDDGKPQPNTGKEIPGTRRFSHGLGVSDVNGDGKLDVICTGGWWEQPPRASTATEPEALARIVNAEPGAPASKVKSWLFHPANLGEACADMHAYDVDGDGKNDIITTSAHRFGIWWFQQRSGGEHPAFLRQDMFRELVSETHAVHCVDMNGDGLKDLVTGKRWWSHGRSEPGHDWPAMLYWFQASKDKNGMIRFSPRIIDIDSGIGTQFVVADFNGDKLLDIVVSNKKGTFLHELVGGK